MKRDKRLRDYKKSSSAARHLFGVNQKQTKRLKKEQRKKLRLANKEIEL